MTTIYEETEWWYQKRVVDFSSYRKYSLSCKFVNDFSFYMTATVPFTSNVIQMNISEGMSEILVFVKFLYCADVNTMFITRIRGNQCNEMGVSSFGLDDISKDVFDDVMHCLEIMFQDLHAQIILFTRKDFEKRKKEYSMVLCEQVSVLRFPGSIIACISRHMRPSWFDYDNDDIDHDIGDDYFEGEY